ncbi:MAG: RNA methyltransferase [Lachnospiraceae bacterium]|nr:RNA methyltransferase [Lachnospiraceae bacterium]
MGKLLYPESKEAWVEVGKFIRALTAEERKEKTDRKEEHSQQGEQEEGIECLPVIRVAGLNVPELGIYQERTESGLLHYFEPNPGLFIAETELVLERALQRGYEPFSALVEEKKAEKILRMLSKQGNLSVPVYTGEEELLKEIAGFTLTRGVLCAMKRKPLPSVAEVCKDSRRIAVLSDVENPTNVGAIFRNAAALGVDAVILTTDCADPLYRRAIRVSMGTVFQIPWTMADDLEELKKLGFVMTGLALRDDAVSFDGLDVAGIDKLALVLGNEANGIAPKILEQCEYTIKIPMYNGVDSLNVAAASAIAFWELTRKQR